MFKMPSSLNVDFLQSLVSLKKNTFTTILLVLIAHQAPTFTEWLQ
jgi:hypothetical protein